MGAITDVVKRYVPASYRALCAVTNSYYSLTELQALADFVQFRLFNTVAGANAEASVWSDYKKRQLLGIITTLNFIPAAIEYWGDQSVAQQGTRGQGEDASYWDRREGLWKLFEILTKEAEELADDIGVTTRPAHLPAISYGDNGRGILVTPDPFTFPPAFKSGSESSFPIWSEWE